MTINVFVYGTLRNGESNYNLIRDYVQTTKPAWVRGWLFDLGLYPAMIEGKGWVKGELIQLKDREQALKILDELEDYYGPGNPANLYERIQLEVWTDEGQKENAIAYVFSEKRKQQLIALNRLLSGGDWLNRKNNKGWIPYFAYGSCMDETSFATTVSEYKKIGAGLVDNCRVAFTRWSEKWQGGVADLIASPGDATHGILYLIHPDQLSSLDQRERPYRRKWVEVHVDGLIVKAFTYEVMQKEKMEIPPSKEYMETILRGAKELNKDYQMEFKKRMESL